MHENLLIKAVSIVFYILYYNYRIYKLAVSKQLIWDCGDLEKLNVLWASVNLSQLNFVNILLNNIIKMCKTLLKTEVKSGM